MRLGGATYKIVVSIGGYDRLLSDATEAQVLAAWADRPDWTQVLTGVTINHVHAASIDPWNPLLGGGKLTIYVPPQSPGNTAAADPFGVEVHRKTAGDETILSDNSLDRATDEAVVSSSSGFAASGTIHIGNEAIGYGSITGNTFETLVRGKWAAFGADASGLGYVAGRFAHDHNLVTDPNDIALFPLVTEQRRTWVGRRVEVRLHLFDASTGEMNLRADALRIYAGRIVSIADDPTTMNTVVHCEHEMDALPEQSIGANLWSGKIEEGIEISATTTPDFDCRDSNDDGTNYLTANPLQVVTSGASTPNQINEGRYTIDQLISKINDWLAAEKAASRLNGTHWINLGANTTVGLRTWLNSLIPGAGPGVAVELVVPGFVNDLFGGFPGVPKDAGARFLIGGPFGSVGIDDVAYDVFSNSVPLRNILDLGLGFDVYDENGTIVENTVGSILGNPNANILFSVDGAAFSGFYDSGSITLIGSSPVGPPPSADHPLQVGASLKIPYDDPRPEIVVRQLIAIEDTRANAIKKIFYSTGTSSGGVGYNHATLDSLPAQLGLGVPGELLGDTFEQSVDQMPGADLPFTLVLDEPKKISEILTGSLIFSWSFLRWSTEDQCLQFCTWSTPTTGELLSDANKAVAVGQSEHQLTPTILTDEWAFPIIKVDFDRDPLDSSDDGGYRDQLTIVDRTAVDNANGQAKIKTIQLRDTFGRAFVDGCKGVFKSGAAMFTREVSKISRSLDSRFFHLSVGASVLITDTFARDPDTGLRGTTTRPALVIGIRWSLGGPGPNGSNADVFGEVDVMLKDVLRIGQYVPCAQVSSYVIGTKVATITAHAHSESSEAVDASHFPVGAVIKWIERDPADPAAPQTHDDTIAGNSGNDLTMTTGFAAYNAAKLYRIISDTYADASATQQGSFAYQADSDAKVQDARSPYEYVQNFLIGSYTVPAANDPIELPSNVSYGDGAPRDVGHEVAIARLINNLIDFKCAHSKPSIYAEMSGAAGGTWKLVECRPINLTAAIMTNGANRAATVAVQLKSSDGASASVRVSITRNRPTGSDLVDVPRGLILGEVTFTTTSTTYAIATASTIDLAGIPDYRGDAYLLVEVTEKARTYGVVEFQVGARSS